MPPLSLANAQAGAPKDWACPDVMMPMAILLLQHPVSGVECMTPQAPARSPVADSSHHICVGQADSAFLEAARSLQTTLLVNDEGLAEVINEKGREDVEAALQRAFKVMEARTEKRDISLAIQVRTAQGCAGSVCAHELSMLCGAELHGMGTESDSALPM